MGSVPWKGIAIICFGSLSFLASQWMLIKLVEVSEKGGEVEIGLGIKSQQGALCLLTFYEIVILFSPWVSFLGSKSFLSKEWLETGEMFWCRWWWCGGEWPFSNEVGICKAEIILFEENFLIEKIFWDYLRLLCPAQPHFDRPTLMMMKMMTLVV